MVMIMSTVMLPTFICVAVSRVTITGTFLLEMTILVMAVFAYLHCMMSLLAMAVRPFDSIFFVWLMNVLLFPVFGREKRRGR